MKTNNLRLSYNLNGKLDCDCFSVIYALDPLLFQPGNLLELYLKDQPLGQVEVLYHQELPEEKLNNWIAYLDTGYNKAQAKQLLRREYRSTKEQRVYSLALLKYVRRYQYDDILSVKKQKQKTLPLLPV